MLSNCLSRIVPTLRRDAGQTSAFFGIGTAALAGSILAGVFGGSTVGAGSLPLTALAAIDEVASNLELRSRLTLVDVKGNRQFHGGGVLGSDLGVNPGAGSGALAGGGPF